MNKSTPDFGIPVLTEIIQTPPRAKPAIPPAEPAIAHAAASEPAPIQQAPSGGRLDEEDRIQLEKNVSERVLTHLLERIDSVLEQRIIDSLAQSLQLAVDEIKQGLHQTLSEVINDAVAQEIDRLQFSKK